MIWIEERYYEDNDDESDNRYYINQKLYYPNCELDRDVDGRTPLMYWIENRRGEPIPDCLYYPNCELDRDKDGKTPLMLWVKHQDGCIPEKLHYPGCELDINNFD